MEQVDLLGAGVQLWNKNVLACRSSGPCAPAPASAGLSSRNSKSPGSPFSKPGESGSGSNTQADSEEDDILVAYCSSLAVFVYDVRARNVRALLAGYEGMISTLAWSLYDMSLLATGSEDGRMVIWDVFTEQRVAAVTVRQAPVCMGWFPVHNKAHAKSMTMGERMIAVATVRGSVILWDALKSTHRMLVQRDVPKKSVTTDEVRKWKDKHRPTVLRCNTHPVSGEIAIGYKDGHIELVSVQKDEQTPMAFYYNGSDAGQSTIPKKPCTGRVMDVQWDPFSPNYLLAAYADCDEIVLWDCLGAVPRVVQKFPLEARTRGITGLAWQSWAPGNFMSVSEKGSGLVHVWNVSQKTPINTMRISSSGSAGVAMCTWGSLCFVGLESGAMVTYDAQKNLELLTTRPSHRETVFDVRFRPTNSETGMTTSAEGDREFATCSFDGRVMVYGARDMECRRTLKHQDKPIIYSVSWSPPPRKWIASCTYTGILSVWDVEPRNAKLLSSVKLHKGPIYRVDWNKKDPTLLATSSADWNAVVSKVNLEDGSLKVLHRLEHPTKTFGSAWDPFYSEETPYLAVGCGNGNVYVWNSITGKLAFKLSKHDAKIFNVTWSPLRRGILASGSDDRTIIVWKLPVAAEKGKQVVVEPQLRLQGHTLNVRALLWSPEMPELLISGSWDGTIRLWDTEKGTCVDVIYDHHADVYGLDADPQRPFTVLSSSRDTTIRVWDVVAPARIIQAKLELICEILFEGGLQARASNAAEQVLRGKTGQRLISRIREATFANNEMDTENKLDLLCELFLFFGERPGMHDMFALLAGRTNTRLIHSADQVLIRHDEQIPSDERPRAVALIKSGRLRSACEALRRGGEWERALALAPAVSTEYWQSLMSEYSRMLASNHSTDASAFLIASGHCDEAIQFHKNRREMSDAMVIAQAGIEQSLRGKYTNSTSSKSGEENGGTQKTLQVSQTQELELAQNRRNKLAREQCNMFLESGRPVLAACALLAVEEKHGAIEALMLAGQPELALCIAHVCMPQQNQEVIIKILANKCERYGATELALQLYRKTSSPMLEAHLMCARINFPKPVRQRLGLRQPDQYLQQAYEALERHEKGKKTDFCQLLELLCATAEISAQSKAVSIGTKEVNRLLKKPSWDFERMRKILSILHAVDMEATISPEHQLDRNLLLAQCCFVGALDAIWKKLDPIVLPMFRALRANLREHPDLQFPVHLETIVVKEIRFMLYLARNKNRRDDAKAILQCANGLASKTLEDNADTPVDSNAREDLTRVSERIVADLQALEEQGSFQNSQTQNRNARKPKVYWSEALELNSVELYARGLPNGNTRSGRRSMFDEKIIRGPCISVPGGGGQRFISLPHALMWAQVNGFSPLNTGARLFPSRYHVPQPIPSTEKTSPKAAAAAPQSTYLVSQITER